MKSSLFASHVVVRTCPFTALSALVALPVLALTSPALLAQDINGAPGAETSSRRLDRVEISGRQQSDTDLRRRAPVAKQIYGRDELDKYGDTNVADVLKRLPGVNVADGSPRMRGLGSGYTLILINGDPAPPGFKLDQLDPAQVERIEMTKGPTADQSAQAVAGAINIILKDAPRVSQRDLRVGLGYNIEHPVPSATFTFGEKIGPAAISVPLSGFQWRARTTVDAARPGTDENDQPVVASQHGSQLNYGHGFNSSPRLNWRIDDDQTVALQGFAQKGWWSTDVRTTPDGVYKTPELDHDSDNDGTWQMLRANAQWNNRFSDTQRVELKAGIQDARASFNNTTYDPDEPIDALGSNRDRGYTQAGKYSQLLGEDHTVTVGWDLEWRRRTESRTTLVNGLPQLETLNGEDFGARIQRQAFYIQDEWEISPQWSTYIGLRNERIVSTSHGVDLDARNTSSVLTPLWHLNYKFDPKGKDMIRGSITRSYKAPELTQLMGRYTLNSKYPLETQANDQLSPDRVGNPTLKPELATGLDVAYEHYLTGGGLFSLGFFHRNINNLIRNVTTLEPASVLVPTPRYVLRPTNFSRAQTSGVEMELKGRAGELLPWLVNPKTALNLRSSLSVYRSRVKAVNGPDNRLDQQQPWMGNVGFDYRMTSLPLSTGANLSFTPGYVTRQTDLQSLETSRARSLDVFAQWTFSPRTSLRVSANNLAPLDTQTLTTVAGDYGWVERGMRTWLGVALEMKL
ncbi:iron complex outermembrane recepter protein [Roseateles sp. YR242]|uniref:TonB-dependent receptor plug domain-containing protein n=1 Tax=Roseateles sp. YR242 TaxID=1855305 RepID=UPI0008D4F175|nr:TonB-dependent receptor [Roseateles sp. YR242]SEL00917.1 iron complex outermembrane recepter protein [Roseateles sp. YR242]